MKEEKKSSKEILSELFDKFNATPPSSPSVHSADNQDDSIINIDSKKKKKKCDKDKTKKKRKKEKKSKRKHDKKSKRKKKKRSKSKEKDSSRSSEKKRSRSKEKKRSRSSCSSSSSAGDSASDSEAKPKQKRKRGSDSESISSKKSYKEGKSFDGDIKNIKKENLQKEVKVNKSESSASNGRENLEGTNDCSILIKSELKSKDSVVNEETNTVILPDVVPTVCKTEQKSASNSPERSVKVSKTSVSDSETLPQVADIFVEELLESAFAAKATSSAEKSKVNIKITDLKKSNILELAEQKLKEKAEKYEEGEITSDSSEDTEALPSLRPIDSDVEEKVPLKCKEEKVKKCSHHKSRKYSHRRATRSRSGSRGRKDSHNKPKKSKSRSRERSRSRDRKRRRSTSQDRKRDEKHKEKRSRRDRSGHRKKDKKESKPDREKKDPDKKLEKKDSDKKEEKERGKHPKERRTKSRERRRNKSKSPLQLPSMILQDNPNKKRRRSRSRTRGLDIDKKKLLEIARKNALSMLKQQGVAVPTVVDPAKVATTITAGGKTVDELTDFCKQLSQKEGRDDTVELSPISDSSEDENEKAFHHPFLIKDRPNNIVMNIRNCAALPVRTHQEKTAEAAHQLRLQFPVSSGQHHRKTENEWVPVEPKKDEPTPPKAAKIGIKALAPVEAAPPPKAIEPPPPPPPELISVFPSKEEPLNINIGDVVGQKLAAIKRLHDNPTDYGAQNLLRDAEDKLARWNESNQLQQPGLFTGSTGARLLTPAELASGQQAWAKKDQLMCAQPVTEGIGKSLLQKMGWKPGEGLGKNHEGTLEPLSLPLKMDKRGLVCAEEVKRPTRFVSGHNPRNIRKPTVKSLEGKHPVSLLLEYCSKRHFNPPIFNVCYESGPSHKRMFLFKVEVNGVAYQPPAPSNNKKQAKSEAAMVCLRALGLMPSTTAPVAS